MPTQITVRTKDDKVILDLSGTIDINSSNVIETVGRLVKMNSLNILCNFEGVELIDYLGISVVAIACKTVLNHKGRFVLFNVPAHIIKLFHLVGLDSFLEFFATEEQAFNNLSQDQTIDQIVKKKLRRRFKRLPMRVPIEYKEKAAPEDRYFKGKALNVSAIGAFVIGERGFALGDLVTARIYLIPKSEPLVLDARVVWIAQKQLQPHLFPGFGIEFYHIDSAKQEQIVKFIEKNTDTSSE